MLWNPTIFRIDMNDFVLSYFGGNVIFRFSVFHPTSQTEVLQTFKFHILVSIYIAIAQTEFSDFQTGTYLF